MQFEEIKILNRLPGVTFPGDGAPGPKPGAPTPTKPAAPPGVPVLQFGARPTLPILNFETVSDGAGLMLWLEMAPVQHFHRT